MVFDPIRDEIVAFGGLNLTGSVADMWRFKNALWTRVHPAHIPPPRDSAVLVFDPVRSVVVMYGGRDVPASIVAGRGGEEGTYPFAADTWTWDGSDWTQQNPPNHPVIFMPVATYDYARSEIVLLGLVGNGLETWTFDGSDWSQHDIGIAKPDPPCFQSGLSFDPGSQTVVNFGGFAQSADCSRLWRWDGHSWTRTIYGLPLRSIAFMATLSPEFDRRSVLIYDGAGGPLPVSTWRWNGDSFEQLRPPHQPSIAEGLLMADQPRHRVLLSGWTWPDLQFQIWSWSGDDWSQVTI